MADQIPQTLGRYAIRAELGRGGFATVYRALDPSLEREVALKILHPQLLADRSFAERFRKEARALAALRHSNIVTIFEVSEADGRLYIAMELAKGPSLAQAIAERGRIPWSETVALLKPVCEALDYAHAQGVVHRDLKPANILLDRERGPLLTDFGFARLMGESSMSMSLSGGILGTPAYIAPEVWELEAAKPPADIYALGCILHEMLTGQVLFAGKTPMQAMRAHDRGPQFPPASAWPEGVPVEVESVIRQALARKLEARYSSATIIWQALNDLETESKAAKAKAERATLAAPWRQEAEAALAAGEWSAARMALGRWLAITPDDPAAQTMRQDIERREAEAQALQRREAERLAAEEADRKAKEEEERRVREVLAQREAEEQRRQEAERRAQEEQARKEHAEQAAREAERLRQFGLAQAAAEQKAREEQAQRDAAAARLAESRRQEQASPTARPVQPEPVAGQQIGNTFLLWWTLATTVGLCIGIIAGLLVSLPFSSYPTHPLPFPTWIVAGLVVGIAQFLVLRRYVTAAGWWILASAMDWALGLIIGVAFIPVTGYSSYFKDWSVISFSLALGIGQWLYLRRRVATANGWWILASTAGWLVAWGIPLLVFWDALRDASDLRVIVPPILAGIVGGLITGLMLRRLLRAAQAASEPSRAASLQADAAAQFQGRWTPAARTALMQWTAVSAGGALVGLLLTDTLGYSLIRYSSFTLGVIYKYNITPQPIMLWAMWSILMGVVVGVAQYLVLRSHVPRAGWWILVSAIDWTAGLAFGILTTPSRYYYYGSYKTIGVSLALGIAQWFFLRRHVPRAGWWIPASMVAWALGWAVAAALWTMYAKTPSLVSLVPPIIGGGIAGGMSGAALFWLLKDRPAGRTQ